MVAKDAYRYHKLRVISRGGRNSAYPTYGITLGLSGQNKFNNTWFQTIIEGDNIILKSGCPPNAI